MLQVIDKTMSIEEAEELGLSKEEVEKKLQEIRPKTLEDEQERISLLKLEGFE